MATRKTLMVEGSDDQHVIMHLCSARGLPKLDEIENCVGVDNLLDVLPRRLRASEEGDIVGVVIDADTDLASRWQALRDRLLGIGYQDVPDKPTPEGTIIDPPEGDQILPRVGVWIMPDNQTSGKLEDFLRFLVPDKSEQLFCYAESCVADIPDGERRFKLEDEPKALIHTWLAWQKKPGRPLGTAITAKFLDPNVAQADTLIAWIKRLFQIREAEPESE